MDAKLTHLRYMVPNEMNDSDLSPIIPSEKRNRKIDEANKQQQQQQQQQQLEDLTYLLNETPKTILISPLSSLNLIENNNNNNNNNNNDNDNKEEEEKKLQLEKEDNAKEHMNELSMQHLREMALAEAKLLSNVDTEEEFQVMLDDIGRVEQNERMIKMKRSVENIKKRLKNSALQSNDIHDDHDQISNNNNSNNLTPTINKEQRLLNRRSRLYDDINQSDMANEQQLERTSTNDAAAAVENNSEMTTATFKRLERREKSLSRYKTIKLTKERSKNTPCIDGGDGEYNCYDNNYMPSNQVEMEIEQQQQQPNDYAAKYATYKKPKEKSQHAPDEQQQQKQRASIKHNILNESKH